jgi:hypothetical protein
MKGKKGVEWPRTIMYVLFSTLLLILGAFFILTIVQDFVATASIADENLKYNLFAHRIIGSENCLAYGDHFGIIDYEKWQQPRVTDCLDRKKNFELELTEFDGRVSTMSRGSPNKIEDYFFVKVKHGNEFTDGILRIEV